MSAIHERIDAALLRIATGKPEGVEESALARDLRERVTQLTARRQYGEEMRASEAPK